MPKGIGIQLVDDLQDGNVYDFKVKVVRNSSGLITQGLVVGVTKEQNMAIIVSAVPGEIKQFPTMGVALKTALLSEDLLSYRHKIRSDFEKDGLKITQLTMYKLDDITIKANY